jgi:hypothetical protein
MRSEIRNIAAVVHMQLLIHASQAHTPNFSKMPAPELTVMLMMMEQALSLVPGPIMLSLSAQLLQPGNIAISLVQLNFFLSH